MPILLHIITNESETLARKIISHQRELPDCRVEVVDLTKPEPDYETLLEKVFEADSIQVW